MAADDGTKYANSEKRQGRRFETQIRGVFGVKYGFAYQNGKIVNLLCGKEDLFENMKSFLMEKCSLTIQEVSKTEYLAEQKKNGWNEKYSIYGQKESL